MINGKQIPLEEKIVKIPESSYRITALSSSHAAWTKIVTTSYLMTQAIKTNSLTTGYCKTLKTKNQLEDIKIFYNKSCENIKYFGEKELKKYEENSYAISGKNRDKKWSSFKKKVPRWVWVSSTILLTGIIISLANNRKSNAPTIDANKKKKSNPSSSENVIY